MFLDCGGILSKTQEKRALRKSESEAFLRERRMNQLAQFEANLSAGEQILNANRDKLSPEEITILEGQLVENKDLLEKMRLEWNL